VENEEQLNLLRRRKCDAAQGYYFARPVAADALAELIQSGQAKSVDGNLARIRLGPH